MAEEPERDLNGLPREKLAEVLDSFRDPEVFNAVTGPWKSRVAWQGGMKARAFMRNHTVDMDEPGDLTATDVAASAHEQLLVGHRQLHDRRLRGQRHQAGRPHPRPRSGR